MGKTRNQINVKFTDQQREMIKELVGLMGGTEAEVVRSIVISWFSKEGLMSEVIKKSWSKKKKRC